MEFNPAIPLHVVNTTENNDQKKNSLAEGSLLGRSVTTMNLSSDLASLIQDVNKATSSVKLSDTAIEITVKTGRTSPTSITVIADTILGEIPPIFDFIQSKTTVVEAPGKAVIPTPTGPRGMRYEDISGQDKLELRKRIIEDNFRYASYMYDRAKEEEDGTEHGLQFTVDPTDSNKILFWFKNSQAVSETEKKILSKITKSLNDIGIEVDRYGHFYHPNTGNLFNLVYDQERKEIAVCFMGLFNAYRLDIPQDQQQQLDYKAIKGLTSIFMGSIPSAYRQAMEIGKLLKEATEGTDLKPVMIGHSHGGALAQAAAVCNGLKGVIFNSEPLGLGLRKEIDSQIGKENRKAFANQIVAFSTKGDWLTNGSINAFYRFGRDHGLPVSSVLGQGYLLPEPTGNLGDKHFCFYEAFKKLKDEIGA